MEIPAPTTEPTKEESPLTSEVTPVSVHRNASWGAIIAIVIILAMVVVGAFYAWGKRVAEEHDLPATTTTNATY